MDDNLKHRYIQHMKSVFKTIFIFVLILCLGAIFFKYYSYIFALNVDGKVEKVERISNTIALMGSDTQTNAQNLFSFAVAIKDSKKNEIYTASTEDRQWAVVEPGKCAKAKFFPYPPWNFDKSGTYYNARLEKLYDCP